MHSNNVSLRRSTRQLHLIQNAVPRVTETNRNEINPHSHRLPVRQKVLKNMKKQLLVSITSSSTRLQFAAIKSRVSCSILALRSLLMNRGE